MSNDLAIAAVTTTLRSLISRGISEALGSGSVTTKPLDKARGNSDGNQVNLFLYHTRPSASWRNMDMPVQVKSGEIGKPPLALELYYLITAYGQNDDDTKGHRLLGRVMSILHDHPVLSGEEIEAATGTELPGSDLQRQVERVRITLQSLSFDEMAQVWRPFQAQYRISAAYEVSVVLIESQLPGKAALPVLARGVDDRGIAIVTTPTPSVRDVVVPNGKPSAELGDTLVIRGEGLDQENLTVRFRHLRWGEGMNIIPLPGRTATQMQVQLPELSADPQVLGKWTVGFYTLSAVIQPPNLPSWSSGELPFALAPTVTGITPRQALPGDVTLTLTCTPSVQVGQRVALLFGEREIPVQSFSPPADPNHESTLTFQVKNAQLGDYVLRLRVDGVDSIPIDFTTRPPQFNQNQTVKIHE